MPQDVLSYLESKGMHLRRAGGWEQNTPCVYCNEDLGSRGRLYINVDPEAEILGLHYCHLCEARGNLTTLKRHFGDDTSITEDDLDSLQRSEILNAAAGYYHDQLDAYTDVFAYLRSPKRGLTIETIAQHTIGYAPMDFEWDVGTKTATVRRPRMLYRYLRDEGYETKDILATGLVHDYDGRLSDTLAGMVTIPYRIAGNVVMIRGRAWPYDDGDWTNWTGDRYQPGKAKYKTPGGNTTRLFNSDISWNREEIYMAEGEFDALVLTQQGFPAMGVPGAASWQEGWNGYLSTMKRVWLVFDRDQAGEKGATKLTEKFGTKVRRVHLSPEGAKCDPTQWFHEHCHTAEEFAALVAEAGSGGLLVSVREAMAEFADVQGQPGLKFGFELMDLMLEPGLQGSQIMILLAKTGTGKTVWLLNTMHRMRRVPGQENMKILFVSLEQTRGEWWDRARRIHRFYSLQSSEEEAARWWENNLLLVDTNRVNEVQLRQILDDFAYQMGQMPDLICLDYLGYWARSFKGEAYERTSSAAMALKAIAKDYRVPIIVPHQVSRVGRDGEEFGADAARDSGVIEETGDFVITIWSPDNALSRAEEEKTGQLHMRIAKSRHGGRGVLLSMQFAPVSLVMVPAGDPLAGRARQEFVWRQMYRDNWEKVLYRHNTGFEGTLETVPRATDVLLLEPERGRF